MRGVLFLMTIVNFGYFLFLTRFCLRQRATQSRRFLILLTATAFLGYEAARQAFALHGYPVPPTTWLGVGWGAVVTEWYQIVCISREVLRK